LNNAARSYVIRPVALPAECHMIIFVKGSQDTSYSFVRNSGYDPGLKCLAHNDNELVGGTSQTEINIAASGAGAPTTLYSGQFGIATLSGGRGGAPGEAIIRPEKILDPIYKYALTVTALSANPNNITVGFLFYEITPKN